MIDTIQYKSCRICGRALSVSDWMTSCSHCKAPSPWDVDNGCIVYRPEITGEQAIRTVGEWWQAGTGSRESGIGWKQLMQDIQDLRNGRLMARGLANQGNIRECELTYVPFWWLDTFASGRIKGYNSEPGFEIDFWEPAEEAVARREIYARIACDPEAVGFEHLPAETGVILPPEECKAAAPATIVRGKDVLGLCIEETRDRAIRNSTVEHVKSKKVDVKAVELKLIFYPVWIVEYTYSERLYRATIDGLNGMTLSGIAPGDWLLRGIALAVGTIFTLIEAAGCIAFMHLCYWLMASLPPDNPVAMIAILVLFILPITWVAPICWFITYPALAFFTRGGNIAAGESKHGYNQVTGTKGARVAATIIGVTIGYVIVFMGWVLLNCHGIWQALALVIALMVFYMLACMVIYQPCHGAGDSNVE